MILKVKKMAAAVFTAAIILIAGFANQAKAFTVNNTDLYLILSNNTTEYYLDLGSATTVLSSGGSWNITSGVTTAGGSLPEHWTIGGGNSGAGFTTLYLSDQSSALNGYTGGSVNNGLTTWFSFQSNTDNNAATTSMTLTQSNPNSYYTLFDGSGLTPGTFGQTVPTSPGANGTIGLTTQMSLYRGNFSTNALTLLSMVAKVTGSSTAGYTLAIGPAVSSVPLPPSLVMFVTGIIALAVIARRKQASI